jgi:hypothetical protein
METKNQLALKDESVYPDEHLLKSILGRSYNAYRSLLQLFDANEMNNEWRYYKDAKAWLCKVQRKKRTIVWMSAWKGYMRATIYLPERHTKEVYALDISDEAKKRIRDTKNVGKSKPCIFEIRNKNILKDFEPVMHFKIKAN